MGEEFTLEPEEVEITRFCGVITRVYSYVDGSYHDKAIAFEIRIFDINEEKIVDYKEFSTLEKALTYVTFESEYGDIEKMIKKGYIAVITAIFRAYTI